VTVNLVSSYNQWILYGGPRSSLSGDFCINLLGASRAMRGQEPILGFLLCAPEVWSRDCVTLIVMTLCDLDPWSSHGGIA
jgi:hypothetical protein